MVDTTLDGGGLGAEAFLVARLDSLWPVIAGGDRRIDGVKVDVQGMEIETIRGMGMLLREFHPTLVVEVHRGVDRGLLLHVLESFGYSRAGFPIEPTPDEIEAEYLDDRSYCWSSSRS
jgi:hypothetical protein